MNSENFKPRKLSKDEKKRLKKHAEWFSIEKLSKMYYIPECQVRKELWWWKSSCCMFPSYDVVNDLILCDCTGTMIFAFVFILIGILGTIIYLI